MGKQRQLIFLREFARCGDAQDAAKKAGYRVNPNTGRCNVARLLSNPRVKRLLERTNDTHLVKAIMERDEALAILSKAARAEIPTTKVETTLPDGKTTTTETYARITAIDSLSKKVGWEAPQQLSVQGIVLNINI